MESSVWTGWEALCAAGRSLGSGFREKAAAGTALALAMQQHAVLFGCFSLLVVLDCLTRWLAIAYGFCRARGREATLLGALRAIPAARRAGCIDSRRMKERGLGKLLLYAVCVLAACLADTMMAVTGAPGWMLRLMVGYMAATEALSVVENLSEAGAASLDRLVTKLKRRV